MFPFASRLPKENSQAACLKRKSEGNADGEAGRIGWWLVPRIMAAARHAERAFTLVSKITSLKSLSFLVKLFHWHVPMKQFSQATKPFSVFEQTSGNSHWLSSYQRSGAQRLGPKPETAKCEQSALSWVLPSSWPAPR
jgi:hypothetical protein